MKKILVTGSTGLLGNCLTNYLQNKNYKLIKHGFKKKSEMNFDLTKKNEVERLINKTIPNTIINLSALTNVDVCEKNVIKAFNINSLILNNIKEIIKNKKINLIHISTDQLYNASDSKVLNKEADIKPINIYSITKLLGEMFISDINSSVIRTNFFGFSLTKNRESFSDWIINNIKKRKKIRLVNNIFFNPLSIISLIKYIEFFLINPKYGVYNLGSRGTISKYSFGKLLSKKLNLDDKFIEETTIEDLNLFTKRPKNMSMDCTKFEKTFNITLPNIDDEISKLIDV